MANWASTDYVIEGPKETLQKIEQAILHHEVEEGSSENWEGNTLKALGCSWENINPDGKGKYLRGFIHEDSLSLEEGILRFYAQEAYGATDFNEVLEERFPDIKVFYSVESEEDEVYATNDKEGKYFPERFYVDTCIDGNYQYDYFKFKSDIFKWLYKITDGKINTEEKVEAFNAEHESSDTYDENYIHIYEFTIIE